MPSVLHGRRAIRPQAKTENSVKAEFIEPMLLLRKEKLPEGSAWLYEIKLDGYRAIAFKSAGKVQLRSRNNNDFSLRYPGIVQVLTRLPDETVIDGEVVALDESGKPLISLSFSDLFFPFGVWKFMGGQKHDRSTPSN